MNRNKQPFDLKHHDLAGHASVDFHGRETFETFSERLTGFNPERFSPVALRLFVQKGEPIITLYALDKSKKDGAKKGTLPVKKFKAKIPLQEFLTLVKRFDFTVTNGEYDLEDIVVTNK